MTILEVIEGAIRSPFVAGFDLDWTLVRPRYGLTAKDTNDWALLPSVLDWLKQYQQSYTIAIFTNEIYTGKKLTMMVNRVHRIVDELRSEGIHPWVFIATRIENIAKPQATMFRELSHRMEIDHSQSFYVGDMAGREQDIASVDADFAYNCAISFRTPDSIFPYVNYNILHRNPTIFIFVGMPGSGKTTYYERYLQPSGCVSANQDTLQTFARVLAATESAVTYGQSVAVDCLNPSRDRREKFLSIARRYQVPAMIVHFVGNGVGWNKTRHQPVPAVAYNSYFKYFEEPHESLDGVPVVQIWNF
jgi:bifunctional polynucleotide phosphatase/kinase